MAKILAIFLGGGLGALMRYSVSTLAHKCGLAAHVGTFAVNIAGCFLLGALYGAMQERLSCLSEELRLFIAVGVLGAFTTFSTFNWEVFSLLRAGKFACGMSYMALSCVIGLLCIWAGYHLVNTSHLP